MPRPHPRRPLPGLACIALACTLLALSASADIVVLKDGRRIEGTVIRQDDRKVVVSTGLGELEFPRSDVKEIVRQKTKRQIFAEREKAAKTADEFFELGEWARKQKLTSLARRAYKRATELERDHAGARKALGQVPYKGEWMKPEERDRRMAEDEAARLRAQGLVLHGERWVTPEEKEKLEAGLILFEGEWMHPDEAKRRQGLEQFRGRWMPKPEVIAREHVAEVEKLTRFGLTQVVTREAILAGPFDETFLAQVGEKLDEERDWFNRAFRVEPGLGLYGGVLAEMYAWNRDNDPYVSTVEHFAGLTETLPPGWSKAAVNTHGFWWVDPYPLSSARVWHRPERDMSGHCAHHFGHLMLNRLGYDGRLLPAWYDEAVASYADFLVHGRNAVFCQTSGEVRGGGGTAARGSVQRFSFEPGPFRNGGWRETLLQALEAGAVRPFDRLAQLSFSELELLDIATGMAIVEWIDTTSPGGLAAFHAELRKGQPPAPARVLRDTKARQGVYDAAFGAAVGKSWRDSDEEWRAWLRTR